MQVAMETNNRQQTMTGIDSPVSWGTVKELHLRFHFGDALIILRPFLLVTQMVCTIAYAPPYYKANLNVYNKYEQYCT